VAQRLRIPFHIFDARREFRQQVVEPFIAAYEAGLTPNPCMLCNRTMKFSWFWDRAEEAGCDYVVTGHYARIEERDGRFLLKKAADEAKDQTYFLYTLTQEQLKHTLFPLGSLTKTEARAIAEALGLLNAKKRDSQDICFIPDGDYMVFMERHTNKTYEGGNYLDLQGNVVGQHRGAVAYTLGQRKGLGLAMGAPVYVCGKDMAANTVTVGPNEALFHSALRANDWNWIAMEGLAEPIRVTAKARSRMREEPATVYPEENGFARVEFDEPQRAITPGQAVVLYDGDTVIGGGTITEVL
jgi:tRNA-specific 2-thiouridylase